MSIHNVAISANTTAGEAYILALVDAGNTPEDARILYQNAQVRLFLRYVDKSKVEHVIRIEAGDVLSQNPQVGTCTSVPVEINPEIFRSLTEEELQTVRPHIPSALRDLFHPSDPSVEQNESTRLAERHVLESLLAMTEEEQALLRERAGNGASVLSPGDFLDDLRAFERSLFDAMLDLVRRASNIPDTHADTPAGRKMIDEIERALRAKLGLRFQENALRSHLARLRRASQFGHAQAAEDSRAAVDAYVADPSDANRIVYLDAFEEEAVYVAMAALDNAAQVVANCRDPEIVAELFVALGPARQLYANYEELREVSLTMQATHDNVRDASRRTQEEARRALSGYDVLSQGDHNFYLHLAAANSVEELQQALDGGRLAEIEAAIPEMRQRLAETPEVIWQLDSLRKATMRQTGHGDGTVPDMLVDDEARRMARERQLEDLGLAGAALALGVVALFTTGPVGVAAAVGTVGLSTADAVRTIDGYMLENAAHDVKMLKSDPWIGWAVLSVAGLGFDGLDLIRLVGHGTQIAAAARNVTRAAQATDTGEEALEVFRTAVRADRSLSASQQNALIEAAKARLGSGGEDAMGLAAPRMPDFDDLPTDPDIRRFDAEGFADDLPTDPYIPSQITDGARRNTDGLADDVDTWIRGEATRIDPTHAPPTGTISPIAQLGTGPERALDMDAFYAVRDANPGREAALMFNPATGDYIVVQGGEDFVPWPERGALEKVFGANHPAVNTPWEVPIHSHPALDPSGITRFEQSFPSSADLDIARYWAGQRGGPARMLVDYTTSEGRDVAILSFDPAARAATEGADIGQSGQFFLSIRVPPTPPPVGLSAPIDQWRRLLRPFNNTDEYVEFMQTTFGVNVRSASGSTGAAAVRSADETAAASSGGARALDEEPEIRSDILDEFREAAQQDPAAIDRAMQDELEEAFRVLDRPNSRLSTTERRNAGRVLGENLEEVGIFRPEGEFDTGRIDSNGHPVMQAIYEAHHIVEFADGGADSSRRVLEDLGIDINHPANGVWLPNLADERAIEAMRQFPNEAATAHRVSQNAVPDVHSAAYMNAVNARIVAAAEGGKDAVLRELQNIRQILLDPQGRL